MRGVPGKKSLILLLVAGIVALPLVLRGRLGGRGAEVDVAVAAAQEIRPSILASGVMVYRNQVDLTAEVTAKVKELLVKEGDTVTAGQLLIRLDPSTYLNEINRETATYRQETIGIERQRVALDLKRIQFERTRRLYEAGMVGHAVFDADRNAYQLAAVELKSSEASAKRAAAMLDDARDRLAKTAIRAPIGGRVVALPIKVGEVAIPSTSSLAGAQLLSLADTSATEAEIKVDEGDIGRVAVGQQARVFAAAWPDTAIGGNVIRIAQATTVENGARAYKVTIGVRPAPSMALRSGMSCRAELFTADGKKRLAVPVEAVLTEARNDKAEEGEDRRAAKGGADTRYVVAIADGVARKRVVTIGQSDDRWQEVLAGIRAGDRIITGPGKLLNSLTDGDKVRLRAADKAVK
ncbi:efflux RND transporter periplasmic adaptor subunit [Paludibacterium paludis]|uniref:MexH family multidrug efflux RND transporter periplasmic adaptor subunit n=1 Tax=Paludibacterium paludis TaxID=1225769 RepID=A0A918NYQ1_9NEIS|nr:efflux RND transporter periplasmic adaptor subunit [Paludibacterium paludis]GGY05467.1 MexH family multidrug efflux RND transporter periplasmic adaptor subunit [Paludibacterium paludis]